MYQKKQMMSLIRDLGYFAGIVPSEEADRKHLQHLVDIQLLVEACFREQQKFVFGKLQKLLDFMFLFWLFITYLL